METIINEKIPTNAKILEVGCGEVSEQIISKDARGAKIGKNLMNRIEDHFISIGCDYVFVDCFAYNKNAFEFYKMQGYHQRMYNNIKKLKKD